MNPIPWYIRFLLFFKRGTMGVDIESGQDIYYVIAKRLWGTTYIMDQGVINQPCTVEYKIGPFKKTKACKSSEEARRFVNYLKNLWGITGSISASSQRLLGSHPALGASYGLSGKPSDILSVQKRRTKPTP